MKKLLLFFVFCYSATLISQVTNEGEPASWGFAKKSGLEMISLPQIDLQKIKAEDDINDKIQTIPYRVGISNKVNYGLENSGTWTDLANGDRIWRIFFSSKDAVHLSVNFDNSYLPKGANIYLYNDDRTDLLGAYTHTSNNEKQKFGTWFVKGDKLWVEYFEPKKVKGQSKLNISSVIHGYRIGHTYQKGYFNEFQKINESGDCNHDVDCPIGADFEAQKDLLKKSVALLFMGNGYICSGALVNNTAEDKMPYFLSANHCYTDPDGADSDPASYSMRFNWISPNPVCGDVTESTTSSFNTTSGGSELIARNAASDVMLVKLINDIPDNWDVTYAGWDKTDADPIFQVGIHHPSGDIMKVSRDDDVAEKRINNGAETWEVTAAGGGWEIGVTEGGSSGSPLFDQNGRVIGQLFGGGAACTGTNDNGAFDFYGRFAVSWDANPGTTTPATRLRDWLDPLGTNQGTLESNPRLETFANDGAVSSIIPDVACGTFNVTPTIIIRNAGTTTLTSLTVNWDIDSGTSTVINWNGSLAQNETENLTLSPITQSTGSHLLSVTSSSPNGVADENVSNDISTNSFIITNEYVSTQVHLELLTDDWAEETTWEFKDSNDNVLYSGGPYTEDVDDNTIFQEVFNVPAGECYTFEIFDSAGDGICCGFGNGSYSLKTDDDTVIIDSGIFGASETTQMSVVNTLAINDEFLEQNISVFPNPTSGFVQIKIKEWVSDYQYEIYNVLGQTLKYNKLQNNEILDLTDLPSDIYFMKITEMESNRILVKKIVLSR
jgi:hypothetical protein